MLLPWGFGFAGSALVFLFALVLFAFGDALPINIQTKADWQTPGDVGCPRQALNDDGDHDPVMSPTG